MQRPCGKRVGSSFILFTLAHANGLQGADEDWAGQLGLKNLVPYTFPKVTVSGLTGFGGGNYVKRPQANNFQFSDSLTWIRGRHALKAGIEYRTLLYGNWQGNAASGTFAFNTLPTMNPQNRSGGLGFASFLMGIPSTTTASLIQPPPVGSTTEHWKSWSAFLQDNYKVTSNLTFNLGLRWEVYTPRTVDFNRQSVFNLKTLQLDYAGQNGYPETLYDYNWKDLQPRIGFAYTPFGNTRTVFRGGYGVFFQAPNQAIQSGFEAGPWTPASAIPVRTTALLSH
jgi:outer membrane receptor protein involved in Fe transport